MKQTKKNTGQIQEAKIKKIKELAFNVKKQMAEQMGTVQFVPEGMDSKSVAERTKAYEELIAESERREPKKLESACIKAAVALWQDKSEKVRRQAMKFLINVEAQHGSDDCLRLAIPAARKALRERKSGFVSWFGCTGFVFRCIHNLRYQEPEADEMRKEIAETLVRMSKRHYELMRNIVNNSLGSDGLSTIIDSFYKKEHFEIVLPFCLRLANDKELDIHSRQQLLRRLLAKDRIIQKSESKQQVIESAVRHGMNMASGKEILSLAEKNTGMFATLVDEAAIILETARKIAKGQFV